MVDYLFYDACWPVLGRFECFACLGYQSYHFSSDEESQSPLDQAHAVHRPHVHTSTRPHVHTAPFFPLDTRFSHHRLATQNATTRVSTSSE